MQLELGGGAKPLGPPWVNVDLVPGADVAWDLRDYPWPFADESVGAVYSSHCLEHLPDPMRVLYEVCRVCREGARVEIRVPAPNSDLAMVWDHRHVLAPVAVRNFDALLPRDHWAPPAYAGPRRLKLAGEVWRPSVLLEEAKKHLPFLRGLSDDVILRWVPRTAHEVCFHFEVVPNEFRG